MWSRRTTWCSAYGADTVRAYLMFFARWDLGAPWNSSGIDGTVALAAPGLDAGRWNRADPSKARLQRRREGHPVAAPQGAPDPAPVTRDFETFEFNTIVSALMELHERDGESPAAGRAGHPGLGRSGGDLPEDAGAGRPAHHRRAVAAAGQALFDPHPGLARGG